MSTQRASVIIDRAVQRRRARRGFSVIELIVTIGAIALITVGVAQIFETVGDTVTGGRRVSGFTQAATTLEAQMRLDMQSLTRDGFLLIHHKETDAAVPLAPGVGGATPRRIDELMFFARGDFTTTRPQVRPNNALDRQARSREARIYYGHGSRFVPDTAPGSRYLFPIPSDGDWTKPVAAGEVLGDTNGPNEYASDWSLLRHVTLLVDPLNEPIGSSGVPVSLRDSEYQIAYQPAAGSLFKALAYRGGNDLMPADMPDVFYDYSGAGQFIVDAGARPSIASGLIDIATTSFEEIRTVITDVGGPVGGLDVSSGHPIGVATGDDTRPLSSGDSSLIVDPADDATSEVLLNGGFQRWVSTSDRGDLPYMHGWMRDALPAYSSTLAIDADNNIPTGQRIRTEPLPPDLVESAFASTGDTAYLFADQIALTGSELLPRCTAFRVEWTFGETDASGAMIWHDLANRYNPPNAGNVEYHETPFRTGSGAAAAWPVQEEVIHGGRWLRDADELYSFFGYFDPSYEPLTNEDPASVPWAWPRLLRVTATFADAQDPSIEQSTQFILEVPQQ